jgi:hypothetical protein
MKFSTFYEKVMKNLNENAPVGAMSSGGNVQSSLENPKMGVYGVWKVYNPETEEEKEFETEILRREFLEKNEDWEIK